MTLKDNIRKILKEDADFSTKFKRRYNWFKNYIKHCFVMEYPCDFENFTAFMQGIHQEIREAIFDGTYYDGEPVSDWLTYEEGAKFVDRHMITQLKEHYYDECGVSLKEESNNQQPKDLSPIIEQLLEGLKHRNKGIICDIKVTAPFNRKTIEPDKSFKHYKIEITFLGGPKRIHEDITDEAWTKAYDYLEQPTDTYSKYVDECGDSLNEQVESNDPDYSLETLNAIKKFVKVLELPLVKDFDVEWSEEQGLYRIKLYYLSRGNIKDINVLQNNEGKLQSVRPFFGLSPYTVAIQSYVVDEK
jgi:hypothetical protein